MASSSQPNIVVSRPHLKQGRGRGRGRIKWNNNNVHVGQVKEACHETSMKLETLKIDQPVHESVTINLDPIQMTQEVC